MTRRTYEAAERQMWRHAFCAALSEETGYARGYPEIAEYSAQFADAALEEFRKRYPKPEEEPEEANDQEPRYHRRSGPARPNPRYPESAGPLALAKIQIDALDAAIARLEQEELSFETRLAEALGWSLQGKAVGLDEMLAEVKRLKEAAANV